MRCRIRDFGITFSSPATRIFTLFIGNCLESFPVLVIRLIFLPNFHRRLEKIIKRECKLGERCHLPSQPSLLRPTILKELGSGKGYEDQRNSEVNNTHFTDGICKSVDGICLQFVFKFYNIFKPPVKIW